MTLFRRRSYPTTRFSPRGEEIKINQAGFALSLMLISDTARSNNNTTADANQAVLRNGAVCAERSESRQVPTRKMHTIGKSAVVNPLEVRQVCNVEALKRLAFLEGVFFRWKAEKGVQRG